MKAKPKVIIGLIIGIALFLIALPLLGVCAEPKPKGTLNIALANLSEEGFLSPKGGGEQVRVWHLVYDNMLYFNEKTGKPIPGLAERFEFSKDGLAITLNVRKGVPWQDTEKWGEVTAEDVKYSYERLMEKNSINIRAPFFQKTVKSIEVVDPYTVKFYFKRPAPEFWFSLFRKHGPIMCKKYVETVGDDKAMFQPIGSGPYRLVERKSGQYLKFEASDEHWRVVPEFKYIIVQIVPEESTRIAMLKTGETDITPVSALKMPDLQKTPGVTAEPWIGGYCVLAVFGGMHPPVDKRYKKGYHQSDPWTDIRVREAMRIAVDREAIIKSIYKGAARPLPIAWSLPGWQDLPPIPYDPERAKKLLAEAGYPNGFEVTLVATSAWAPAFELPQVMEIVAAYYEAIGLKAKIEPMEKGSIRKLNRAAKDVGMIFPWKNTHKAVWGGSHDDKFMPNGSAVHFSDDTLSALLKKFEAEVDVDKRAAYLAEVRDYRYKQKMTIPLFIATPVWAWRTDKVGEWPRSSDDKDHKFSYVRHAKPLNTWRLFTP
jgi:peptide/nickel transport system substrate-binding protein